MADLKANYQLVTAILLLYMYVYIIPILALKTNNPPTFLPKTTTTKNDPSDTVVPGALGGKNRNCNLVSIFQSES